MTKGRWATSATVARAALRRRIVSEDGNSTIEFVLLFPLLFTLFLMSVEVGVLTTREAMLARGTDLTVRDLRLTTGETPDAEELRRRICERAAIIPNCMDRLMLELEARPLADWSGPRPSVRCVDRTHDPDPVTTFRPGLQNQLMVVRVCALFEPLFPAASLGFSIAGERGLYGITTVAGFVHEPE
ncbi:TadE/TadG family type IV pilus assembly protein [Histidinibacterium lentulum]|uniref:TadE/TadG family type IV pilus assembly protein n=1 Tax=Histidinibacterium lentulum TaxID=2480588 RepID=UPI0024826B78|nr:TadE/TadG family type IV pilus assembly protein [Histidinibacterium lentulum]